MTSPSPLPTGPRRTPGRPARISAESVIAASLEIGLEDLTVTELASRLGVTPAAVYRRFGGRDEVVHLVAEHLVAAFDLPPDEGQHWREYLVQLALRLRRSLLAHPGLSTHLMQIQTGSVELLRMIDRCDQVLVARGLDPVDAVAIASTVARFAVGSVESERLAASRVRSTLEFREAVHRHGHELPVLAVAAPHLGQTDPDTYFTWQVRCLVDGIERSRQRGELPWKELP